MAYYVYSGQVSQGVVITNNSMSIYSGGTANATTVYGGDMHVSNGGTANYTTLNLDSDQIDGGYLHVSSGGTANVTIVNYEGRLDVHEGGVANDTTVNNRGSMHVSNGGKVTGTLTIADGAVVSAYAGSIIDFDISTVALGAAAQVNDLSLIQGAPNYTITVSETQANGTYILAGGAANFDKTITVNTDNGDTLGTVSVGGELVCGGGTYKLSIYDGVLSLVVGDVISGEVTVSSGSVAENVVIGSGGHMYVSSGGTANSTFVNTQGSMYVYSGGTANDTTVNNGGSMTVSSGGGANDTTVNRRGNMYVYSGGTANDTTVNRDGKMHVYSGGTANKTTLSDVSDQYGGELYVSNGGTANATIVYGGGYLHVSSGGTANVTIVNYEGRLDVHEGGVANDTTVNNRGWMHASNGGKVTGTLTIADGAIISADAGSIIDFDISTVALGAAARVNDLSLIQGAPNYTITVSETQANGTYILAGGAADFDSMITVVTNTGSELGTISVGDQLVSGGGAYKLSIYDDVLSLVVGDVISGDVTGSQTVSSGSVAENAVIGSGGHMYVSSGGTANSTFVNIQGSMYVYSGGVTNDTNVYCGVLYVFSGGGANKTTVNSFGHMYVSSGGTANSTFVNIQGSMYVYSGGVTNDTNVYCGVLYVFSGGVANSTTVSSGGHLVVFSGGTANSTTVSRGGMIVDSDGVANSTTVSSNGYLSVDYGGTAYDVTISAGGMLGRFSWNYDRHWDSIENGLALVADNVTIVGNDMYVSSGGVANQTTVTGGHWYEGYMFVSSGGVANQTTVAGGNWRNGYLYIESGGTANSTFVNTLGSMSVSSGGVANQTTVNDGGRLDVYSGGVANDTTVNSSGYLYIRGAVANQITVNSSGYLGVRSGGTANSTTVNNGGDLYVFDGGVADLTTLNGGDIYVYSGGTAAIAFNPWQTGDIVSSAGATVNYLAPDAKIYHGSGGVLLDKCDHLSGADLKGGEIYVYSGGVADNTTIRAYDEWVDIEWKEVEDEYGLGTGESYIVRSDFYHYDYGSAVMHVSSGGVANSTTVINSGALIVSDGGVANDTLVSKNVYYDVDGYQRCAAGSMYICSGGVVNSTTIVCGVLDISGGVTANYTHLAGGEMYIYSGGVANRTAVEFSYEEWAEDGCHLYVCSGGIANGITVAAALGYCAEVVISSGGKVTGGLYIAEEDSWVTVESGGIIDFDISTGAPGDEAQINELRRIDGSPDFTITVSETQALGNYALAGGAAEFDKTITVMTDAGSELGTITVGDQLVSGGTSYTLSLCDDVLSLAVGDVISGDVTGEQTVSSGHVAENAVIGSGGELTVASGGTVSATVVSSSGSMTVASGGTASDVTVGSGGGMTVENGGSATQVTISAGGTLGGFGFDEEKHFDEIVNGSATVADQVVIVGSSMYVLSNGAANGIIVNDGASMLVSGGGVVADASVGSGGSLLLSSGGKTTGTLTIADGAVVSAYAGSIIDFDISGASAGGAALVNDLSLIQGTPDLTITVSETQAAETYRLADGAASFDGTITVNADSGTTLGTLTVGGELLSGSHIYSLVSENGVLSLVVTIDTVPPNAPVAQADITVPTNQNVTVTAIFSDDSTQKQYSLDGTTWQSYTTGLVMSANGTVYFRGIDEAGNISDVTEYAVANIDRVAPVKPTASQDITAPTNGNVTVNAECTSDDAAVEYSFDLDNWSRYTTGVVMNANGTLYFRAVDEAGNVSGITIYTVNNIDKIAPTAPTAKANTTAPTNQDVTVTAAFSDNSVVRQYSSDGETWFDYDDAVVMSNNGTVYFRGIDEAGNISDVTEYAVSNIDKTAPDVPTVKASTTKLTNQNVTVTATFSEDSATKQYSTDNETWKTYSKALTVKANGTYYFRATDAAGNTSKVTSFKVANIDKVAPMVTVSNTKPTNKNITITATFTKSAAKKQYSTDKKTWKTYSKALTIGKNGTYYFRGVDKNKKASTIVTVKVANIDKTAPKAPTVKASTTKPTNQNITITATFSKDSAKKQYSTNNKTWKTYSKALSATKNGTYYFRGVDAAGNISKVASIKVANIDKTAPAAPTVKLNTTNAAKSVTITATFSKDSAKKQYSTDKKTWKTYSKALSVKANGTYYFRGIDAAGNVSKVKSIKVANYADTANNSWDKATVLKGTVLAALEVKTDKVDYYDVGDVAQLMLDMEKGKTKVSFYDENKKAVKVSAVTMADGIAKENVSSLTLTAGNGTTDNFTLAAVDEGVKYLKIETADKTLDSYKLAKLA